MLEDNETTADTRPPTIGHITQLTEVPPIAGDDLIDNLLIREDPQPAAEDLKPETADGPLYDPAARNRFECEVRQGGQKFDVAHVFGPLSDERYMQWARELRVRGTADDINEESREATVRLWDDIIIEVENVEYPEGADWKSLIDSSEKLEAVNDLLAVAIVEPEETTGGKLKLGPKLNQEIVTEAWQNGEAVQQSHILRTKTFEFEKKYERIQAKRIRQEPTRGLRRKPKVEYIPQDDKLGALYDEMWLQVDGFAVADTTAYVPLRFKVLVVNYIFAPTLNQKKPGK